MIPTRRAALLLAGAAASAFVLPGPLAALLSIAVLVAAAVDSIQIRERPTVVRQHPETLARGVPAELTVRAKAAGRHQIRQPMPPDLSLDPRTSEGPLQAHVTALRRGRHQIPPSAVRLFGPLGLAYRDFSEGGASSVRVLPDMPAARRLAVAVRRGHFQEEGKRSRGPLGLGTEFESIRDYLPDDDIRQVNWRASARLGKPMSNMWRVEQDREVICVVDAGRLMGAPILDRTRLDAAVDVVAAISTVADEVGDRCGVLVFDNEIRRHVRPRRSGAQAVIEAIFDVEPSTAESDYELAFRTVDSGKRAFVLVLTDLIEPAAAQPLVDAIGVLARRHAVAVATARDPEIDDAINTPPETVTGVLRAAVGLSMIEAREATVAAIGGSGADVIETDVDRLSSACVGAYLRAKSRARL